MLKICFKNLKSGSGFLTLNHFICLLSDVLVIDDTGNIEGKGLNRTLFLLLPAKHLSCCIPALNAESQKNLPGHACWQDIQAKNMSSRAGLRQVLTWALMSRALWKKQSQTKKEKKLYISHRLRECFGLEGTFKSNPPAMCRDIFHYIKWLKAPSNLALNSSMDGVSTASLDNLFQCFTTLIIIFFFLIYNLNLPSFHL